RSWHGVGWFVILQVEGDPASSLGDDNLGRREVGEEHLDRAIALFVKALSIAPRSARSRSSLSWALVAKGDTEHAWLTARRTLAVDPEDRVARFVDMSGLLAQGRQVEAADAFVT